MLVHSKRSSWYCCCKQLVRFGSAARRTLSVQRSQSKILELVSKRVQERDNWKVNGVVEGSQPPLSVIFQVIRERERRPKLSQEELDRDFPVQALNWQMIKHFDDKGSQIQITWLGHASLLVQFPGGITIVTDPVFSERPSLVQWLGPRRYRPPPCSVSEICENLSVDAVLISHNHYDHLDFNTVEAFHAESPGTHFVAPLGLAAWFRRYVSETIVIHEVDWHESTQIGDSQITAMPMRHWSNRIGDRDKTLWCGYCVETNTKRFLFPGDTGWFDDLEEVGNRYGPFDLAAIPIGAYEPRAFMKYYHINVEEAVRMKDLVQADFAVPIHYGVFPLTTEPVLEPPQKLVDHMKNRDDAGTFEPWLIGETKVF